MPSYFIELFSGQAEAVRHRRCSVFDKKFQVAAVFTVIPTESHQIRRIAVHRAVLNARPNPAEPDQHVKSALTNELTEERLSVRQGIQGCDERLTTFERRPVQWVLQILPVVESDDHP